MGSIETPGQRVAVIDGVYRGRVGVVHGKIDGTNSIRVVLDRRSKYDADRPKDWAWIPVAFLNRI